MDPTTRRNAPKGVPRGTRPSDRDTFYRPSRHLALVPRVPFDPEAELSVLAELAAPMYVIHALDDITEDYFYDERNRRCFRAVKCARSCTLSTDDSRYLENAVRFAWPLSAESLAAFLDCADRRRELFELERRRLELLGVA